MIDSKKANRTRESLLPGEWSPGKRLLSSKQDYQRCQQKRTTLRVLRIASAVLRHRFWSALSGADIPLNCLSGGGLLLPHPNGVAIYPDAQIDPNCLIVQQVTVGTLASGGTSCIGGHVDIGAGAKPLGKIVMGDHARIGANAVVLADVPPGAVAVGAPARCLPPDRGAVPYA